MTWRIKLIGRLAIAIPLLAGGIATAQQAQDKPATERASAPAAEKATTPQQASAELTEAERIIALQRLVQMDQERLVELESDSRKIAQEFDRLSKQLGEYDENLMRTRSRLDEARRGSLAAPATELEAEIANLDLQREEARKEFDSVIARRRVIDKQLALLPEKLKLEQQGLDRLTKTTQSDAFRSIGAPSPARSDGGGQQVEPVASIDSALTIPVKQADVERIYDPVVAEARKALLLAEQQRDSETERVQLLDRGIDLFQSDHENTREILDSARRNSEAAQEASRSLRVRLDALAADGAPASEIRRAREELLKSEERIDVSQRDVSRYSDRLDLISVQLGQLQGAYDGAVKDLDLRRSEAEQARERLVFLEGPLAPHRIYRWLMREGVVVLVVLFLMIVFWMLAQLIARRVVMTVARKSHRGSELEREGQAQTLKRVFQSLAGIVITILGGIVILDQVGIDVTVLLGSAAVLGMAVAFGAQALIKDYFSGFIMLLENQYRVGNVVRIGAIAGSVEDVTLRITVLRDLEGVAHFIPHGQVATVSNLTHGWSRVVFDIGVGYSEDVDHVMDVLARLAKELREDPKFGPLILAEAEMLGVDEFGDSAVVVKFMVKTRPLQQWVVKRELLRRIKHEFDAQGIEIPFPHRTVYHRAFSDKLAIDLEGPSRDEARARVASSGSESLSREQETKA